ncbi:MAG: SHIRT domain-containing protein, partial [Lachnospiraceae bacterium]|nr:SHIRT domain-containing protein [Lachnospiraceae bacterium]
QLRKAAEDIRGSYALNQEDADGNKIYPDGYPIDDSYRYFRFVVGDPKDGIEAQSISDMSVYASDSSVGAMYGLRVTEEASLEDAAPTPTDVEDENGDEMQSDDNNDSTVVPEEPEVVPTPPELLDNDMTPTDTAEPDDTATPDSDANDNSAAQEGQPDNAVQSNDVMPEAVTSQPDNAASEEQATTLSDENENAGTDSASAVIYVQFDENNSVLVASLGNVGVADALDGSDDILDIHSEQEDTEIPSPSPAAEKIVNGAIPTVTSPIPTQENGGDTANSDNNSSTSDTTGSSEDENTGDESGSNNGNTGDDDSAQGSTDGSENTDGDDRNAEVGDGEDGEDDVNGEDQEKYTVAYRWEGLDHEIGTFTEPDLPEEQTVKDEEEIAFPADPEPIEVTDEEGVKIGTYVFEGWKVVSEEVSEDADDTDTPVEESKKTIIVVGTWNYHACENGFYLVTYQWRLTGEEGGLPDGLTVNNIVLKSPFQTFGMSEQPEEIGLPEEGNVQEGSSYTLPDDYEDAVFDIYDTDGNYIGIGTFEGWENSDGETLEGEIVPDGDMTVYGVLRIATYDLGYKITYKWSVRIENEDDSILSMKDISSFPENGILLNGTVLPNGVKLINGGYLDLDRIPVYPDLTTWGEGSPYMPADPNVTEVPVYDENYDLVGTYYFVGWASEVDGEREMLPPKGLTIESNITLYGVWSYKPEATAERTPGNGYAYVYVNDTIHNNDWFRYYVMGLEEKDFGTVNIKLVVYLADGSEKREYGYGPDCPTLTEAIQKADLVYLNTDGVWGQVNDDGDMELFSSDRRFPAETAKALLERACNVDRSARVAVILDNDVRNNQVDVNIQKVTTILCQEDLAKAYASLSEEGMSYEKAFSSVEWQRLNALAVTRNGGNFVHDNIYCVGHRESEFRNSTYSTDGFAVNPESMATLVNADFENRFTDYVTDAGFAEVYQAIQKENYERARNGGQASLDEYVMPATAVAYILNYRDYDPIIYKDKIRVLELEPCR